MDTRKTVVGAAAMLAAGVVSVTTAPTASASPSGVTGRITSVEQLKSSIHQAVVIEAASVANLSCCPEGEFV